MKTVLMSEQAWILGAAITLAGCAGSDGTTPFEEDTMLGAGGYDTAGGGAPPGTGGFTPTGTGGVAPAAGGVVQGAGATPGAGGTPLATGGVGAGGAPLGTGGVASGGGGAVGPGGQAFGGSGTGGTPAVEAALPRCIDQANQVAIIGDSYITGALTPALQPVLDGLLTSAGLVAGYPNHAIAGTAMGSGGLTGLIPNQFDTATTLASDIRLVIMDGGGNDVLIPALGSPDCKNMVGSSSNPGCQAIVQTAVDAAASLITKMANAGVRDVVYFFYPHIPPTPGGLGGSNPNEILDYAYPLGAASCDGAWESSGHRLRCHWIDMRQPFEQAGGYSNIASDGVHPAASGQDIIAGEILATMQSNCLGQPTSSGCCAP